MKILNIKEKLGDTKCNVNICHSNKKLLLSDDDSDIEVNNQVDLNDDDSIELEGSDTEAKTTADLNLGTILSPLSTRFPSLPPSCIHTNI